MTLIPVSPGQVTPALRSLFEPGMPASLRCFAVLDGQAVGRILTDQPVDPTRGLVQEAAYGTIYLGGPFDAPLLGSLVAALRRGGDVLIGLWPDDALARILPPNPEYEGFVVDFTDRPPGEGLEVYLRQVPAGCEVGRVDRALFERCADRDLHVAVFGSAEKALTHGLGFCLMRDDEILCEAFTGPPVRGIVEIGVATREPYEGRGYATLTCAHLIRACEERGYQTYWNCDRQNLASLAIARKLGYRKEEVYRLVAWFKAE